MEGTLLLGAGGLLGSAFAAAHGPERLTTAGRAQLQGQDEEAIRRLVAAAAPRLIVNCAAHVLADDAERDPAPAVAANVELPRMLARAAREAGALLVHISSTGCYGAWKDEPYSEADPLRPTTVHHRTKAEGEEAVRAAGGDHLIVRTGWLFASASLSPKNFVWRRLLEASATDRLLSDASQRGCPTAVEDVARQVLACVEAGARGTLNVVSQGSAVRTDYVRRIVAAAALPCEVVAGPAFKRLAPVSPNETAVNARLQELGLDRMPDWGAAVDGAVARLRSRLAAA